MRKQRSTVAVFNLALAWLGGEQLSSVESDWEESALGRLCRNNFPQVLDMALTAHDWGFALKRAVLARKEDAAPHPLYSRRYALPADCLRASELMDEPGGGRFVVEGRDLLTDAAPARLLYVARSEDPASWPPEFVTALSWGLAGVLASARLNDTRKQEYCLQNYERAMAEAIARDLNQQRPVKVSSAWLAARFGHGEE